MKDRKIEIQAMLFRLFLLVSLFFPAFYSPFDANYLAEYFVSFSAAYLILVFYLVFQMVRLHTRPQKISFWIFLGVVIVYNIVSLYFNAKYLHWYWEQINNTIAFLLFVFLVGYGEKIWAELEKMLSFFIKAVVVSNLASILYFIAGYTSFIICNNHLVFYRFKDEMFYHEFRHYWLYSHKSDYSVMLLCFLALCLCYRKRFKRKSAFGISMAVLITALVTTHSWTGYLAGMLLGACAILDLTDIRKILRSLWGKLALGLTAAAGISVAAVMLKQRNILTLGDRLPIWKGIIRALRERPQGLGFWFGEYAIQITESRSVTNAHNVFLNQMLRFSVPVGIVFTILILLAAVYCVYKSKTWLSVGMWAGLLMLLNMDYALLNYEVAMVLLCAYLVCIFPGVLRKEGAMGDKV